MRSLGQGPEASSEETACGARAEPTAIVHGRRVCSRQAYLSGSFANGLENSSQVLVQVETYISTGQKTCELENDADVVLIEKIPELNKTKRSIEQRKSQCLLGEACHSWYFSKKAGPVNWIAGGLQFHSQEAPFIVIVVSGANF